MNACILGNVMAMERRNDQKVANCARAKAQHKWDKLIIVIEQCPKLPKPTLVKLAWEQLLEVLGFNVWGVGNMPQDVTSLMEKDEDL
jgi:hypothetical protein